MSHTHTKWTSERMTEIYFSPDEADVMPLHEITTEAGPYEDFETIGYIHDSKYARLIAAAPDLLAALENLVEKSDLILSEINSFDCGWYYQFQAAIQQARQALAKATDDPQGKE